MDHGKAGCERAVQIEADDVPLVQQTTPANVPDQSQLPALFDARPTAPGPRRRPRRYPKAILGDCAYGVKAMISRVKRKGIDSLLAERSNDTGGRGLVMLRRVVERTLACLSHYRRLRLCYGKAGIHC